MDKIKIEFIQEQYHLIYLKLLEKRLKKFEYLKANNINISYFDNHDNSYLEEKDHSNILGSHAYFINNRLNENETRELKYLLEEKINNNDIYDKNNNIKTFDEYHDELVLDGNKKIRFLGYSSIYDIKEFGYKVLTLDKIIINIFEVIDDLELKYIYHSSSSKKFYKLNQLPKIDYKPDNNCELYINNGYDGRIILSNHRKNKKTKFISNIYFNYDKNYHITNHNWRCIKMNYTKSAIK